MPGLGGIGMGLGAAGGIIQGIASKLAADAMYQQYQQELARQGGYRGQAMEEFGSYLPTRGVETVNQQLQQGAQGREQRYADIGNVPLSIGQGSGPTARDKAQYTQSGAARAKLGAYSDSQLLQDIANIRAQDQLNKISNFAAGTAGVFPYRMHDAQHSQDALSFVGSLLSVAGGGAANFDQFSQSPPMNFGARGDFGAFNMGSGPQRFDYLPSDGNYGLPPANYMYGNPNFVI